MAKTFNKKRDFIEQLMSMSDVEINEYIKQNGKPPKSINLINIIDKSLYDSFKYKKIK